MTSKGASAANMQDVPIFLRKTFEMIRTCDPTIAGWSEDGETFVVKDPIKFETTIIPQFFKHNKFTSFVRQLNFYSFRKIKYVDSLRLDPKLEAETANFWRFKHDNFRRDRPDLLTQIKRMNSAPRNSTNAEASVPLAKGVKAAPVVAQNKAVTTEVETLKQRIEEMNKNIGELTAMVKKVNLKQEEQEKVAVTADTVDSMVPPGQKRKKVDQQVLLVPEKATSMAALGPSVPLAGPIAPPELLDQQALFPDPMISSMDLDDVPMPEMPSPQPLVGGTVEVPKAASRETSTASSGQVSDIEFVDQLLNAFGDEGGADSRGSFKLEEDSKPKAVNTPDPELMQRLSDALMVLPKEIQEMIVERLIQAITSPSFLERNGATPPVPVAQVLPEDASVASSEQSPQQPAEEVVATPLAAATLAALLHHYSAQMANDSGSAKKTPKSLSSKTLPVIPVHA